MADYTAGRFLDPNNWAMMQPTNQMMGFGRSVGDFLTPDYLRQPQLQNMPTEPGKIPQNQIDPGMAASFGLGDLATMFMGGGAKAAAPVLGLAARYAPTSRMLRGIVEDSVGALKAATPGNREAFDAAFSQLGNLSKGDLEQIARGYTGSVTNYKTKADMLKEISQNYIQETRFVNKLK